MMDAPRGPAGFEQHARPADRRQDLARVDDRDGSGGGLVMPWSQL
ncbi:MAG TPA: hypothetical protein VFC16_17270 [Nakamurella sp.]|nr:hypothetical protein [Nakamurella sp.]